MKTHWKQYQDPKYLGAYSLGEKEEMQVTIEKVVREEVKGDGGKGEIKTVAYLKKNKPMILNSTNCKTIAKIYDSAFIEDWVDKTITVYRTKVNAFGDVVEALRVRKEKPAKVKLTPNTPLWDKAKEGINKKTVTLDQIKNRYELSKINEKLLTDGKDV